MTEAEKCTEHERRMDEAKADMDNQPVDPTAQTPQYQANAGMGTGASAFVSTSPKIAYHDRIWESLRNAHPYLESSDVEALMEYCYGGRSVYEASKDNFESFDPDSFNQIMNMGQEEVEGLLYGEDELE